MKPSYRFLRREFLLVFAAIGLLLAVVGTVYADCETCNNFQSSFGYCTYIPSECTQDQGPPVHCNPILQTDYALYGEFMTYPVDCYNWAESEGNDKEDCFEAEDCVWQGGPNCVPDGNPYAVGQNYNLNTPCPY